MITRPPPLPKNEEKYRKEILDHVEEGRLDEEWTRTMPQLISDLLQKNFTSTRNSTSTRVSHATEGIQWKRMEEIGKALTNRCRAVRELSNKTQKNLTGTRDRNTNSEQLEFECELETPTGGRIHELLNLGATSSQNLFQSLITNQDLKRLREDMWPSHKTLRMGWWCRAFATAINRQCPTCNRLWTTEQIPPSLTQCLACSRLGTKKKPSKFKLLDNQVGLIFRSALPEELEWDNRAEDVAPSLDAIQRCLSNMLTALDRDTPQTKIGLAPHNLPMQEPTTFQEPPWLWFTLPELGFPLLTDEYRRPIHPEIEEYMQRYVSNVQDWEQVDDEDCWGINYTEPAAQITGKIETILHIWGEEQPEKEQDNITKLIPERERFSVPHAARNPKILKDRNLENEDIFELIKNPPEVGAVRIFQQPEFWDTSIGPTQAVTTQGIATIYLPSGPLSMDGAQWHLLKHTLTNDGPNPLGSSLQNELTRQLRLDQDKKHRSFSWKLLRTLKGVFHATKQTRQNGRKMTFVSGGHGKAGSWRGQ